MVSREESDEPLHMTEEDSIVLEDEFVNALAEQRETTSEEDSPLPFIDPKTPSGTLEGGKKPLKVHFE